MFPLILAYLNLTLLDGELNFLMCQELYSSFSDGGTQMHSLSTQQKR